MIFMSNAVGSKNPCMSKYLKILRFQLHSKIFEAIQDMLVVKGTRQLRMGMTLQAIFSKNTTRSPSFYLSLSVSRHVSDLVTYSTCCRALTQS